MVNHNNNGLQSRLIAPGQHAVHHTSHETAAAHPSQVVLHSAGESKVITFGGFTKLEAGALQIAAGLATRDSVILADIPDLAVDVALETLKACERFERQNDAPQE